MNTWEVRYNGGCYGHFEGSNAEKQARECFRMRLGPRLSNSYRFELVDNGRVVSAEDSAKGKILTAAAPVAAPAKAAGK